MLWASPGALTAETAAVGNLLPSLPIFLLFWGKSLLPGVNARWQQRRKSPPTGLTGTQGDKLSPH